MQSTLIDANENCKCTKVSEKRKEEGTCDTCDIEKKYNDVKIKFREAENKIYSLRREVELKEEDLVSK